MQLTQPLHSAADMTPDQVAIWAECRAYTWAELRARVGRLAAGLRQIGIKRNAPIAVLAGNSHRYTEVYLASWWAGAVVVPLNTRWTVSENLYALKDVGAEVLFVGKEFLPDLQGILDAAPLVRSVIFMEAELAPAGMIGYEQLIADCAPLPDENRGGEDIAGVYYTGGTTGLPKGVMLSHRALWYNGLVLSKEFGMDARTRYLHAAPMFHLADGAGGLATTMVAGAHVYLSAFTPSAFVRCVAEHEVTHAILVPAMLGMVLESEAFDAQKLVSLRTLIYGASPMPTGIMRRAMEMLPSVKFVQVYGQTELGPVITVLSQQDHCLGEARIRSAGRTAPGVRIKIVDEGGADVSRGDVGEIVASSPGVMAGYWNRPDETAAVLSDGWVRTGDGAYIDDDGYIYIVDRVKDMIVTGGENVFSVEVENAISTHPAVAQVAVFGIPSKEWGEAVHATVVMRDGHSVSDVELAAHIGAHIANYKRPKSFTIQTAPLPLSGAGKILKRELRKPFWDGSERAVN